MKRIIYIGNRSNALKYFLNVNNKYRLEKIFVLKDSYLENELSGNGMENLDYFKINEKKRVIDYLFNNDFDILISNGNPFILPVKQLNRTNRLFINVHPTFLPHLKGKTPLNGVFYLDYKFLGATAHFMDDDIDTGNIIYQKKVRLTKEIDQGLVYYISFQLEIEVFTKAMKVLEKNNFNFNGKKQEGQGSYFNRDHNLFKVDFNVDDIKTILRKVKSLGTLTLGCELIDIDGNKIKAIEAEEVINNYLKEKFINEPSGKTLLVYDNKVLFKTIDGVIKVTKID